MQNPEDLVRATQEEQAGREIVGGAAPLEDLDALSKELGGAPGGPSGGEVVSHGGLGRRILSVFFENKLAVVGVIVIIAFLLFCYVGPLFYHTNQTSASVALFAPDNAPPGNGHPLGTDSSGFDILGRLMYAGQISLLVGFAAAAIASVFGALYGAISGFFGSWLDPVLMRIVDAFLCSPPSSGPR
jgi:peptide/nickel transport system permease protein